MCGISGIISKNGSKPDLAKLSWMTDLIAHRGPDGDGFYTDSSVGFGHRRLAIIDLTSDGHQPMHYFEKYTITFNGEIYNYLEIKEELSKLGYKFQTKSDTEVLLASYDYWGEDCVNHFNGMWAFAIHDKIKKVVFCSRDRFGVKPFYFTEDADFFNFGSEIKQLLDPHSKHQANKDLLGHYLLTGMHDHEEDTFFIGIKKLLPSHNLVFDLRSNTFTLNKYYSIPRTLLKTDYSQCLSNAVKLRLRSDVKVGTCLSGGLDSSTIAAIASKLYQNPSGEKFSAIHAKSVEKATDESSYAIEVAKHSNINLHIIEPSADEFKAIFDEVIYTQEEPFASPSIYLQYFVMKEARRIDCKVMLDGQGGDETLLGYERYYAPAFASFFKNKGLWSTLSEMKASRKNNSKMGLFSIIKYMAGTFLLGLRHAYLKNKLSFIRTENFPNEFSYWKLIRRDALNIFKIQETELFMTNLPALLRYEDKNSMRHGIETRLPFIDYKSVESALNLPTDQKIHDGWTKHVLRKVCEQYLPSNIAWRKSKLGFNAPDKTWLNTFKDQSKVEIQNSKILDHFIDKSKVSDYPVCGNWTITWRLLNIAAWERIYKTYV